MGNLGYIALFSCNGPYSGGRHATLGQEPRSAALTGQRAGRRRERRSRLAARGAQTLRDGNEHHPSSSAPAFPREPWPPYSPKTPICKSVLLDSRTQIFILRRPVD